MSFDKLLEENGVPAGAYASFMAGLKTSSAGIHPQDIAIGALVGAGYAGHRGMQRHKKLPTGESTFSNKARHEIQHHLETRQSGDKPSFMDRMKEKLIRGKLRYARLAEGHPLAATAMEAGAGAVGGALGGHIAGQSIRNSKALTLAKRGSALEIADTLGLSREALVKKSSVLGVSIEHMVDLELEAMKLSQVQELSDDEAMFLHDMDALQRESLGPGKTVRPSTMSATMKKASPQGSIGQILIEREQARQAALVPEMLPEMAASQIEPNDYREPARHERGRELLGIFGGPSAETEKSAYVFGASEPLAISSRSGGINTKTRVRMARQFYNEKSKESPTSLGTAIGTGALAGGGLGALAGLGGGPAGIAAGAALGGLGGGAVGALAAAIDEGNIEKARRRRKMPDSRLEEIIARKIDARERSELRNSEHRSERRHREMMGALRRR